MHNIAPTAGGGQPARRPLEGLRVLDLTVVWSGPLTTRILAELGAQVIKVERPEERPDPSRDWGSVTVERDGRLLYKRNSYEMLTNGGKYTIALDLKKPRAREVLLQLVMVSDVLVENFTPRVMPSLGLSYEQLRRARPDLVMLSMPGMGLTGPERDYAAFGISVEQLAGLVSMQGYAGEGPHKSGINYGDPIAGVHGAVAVLAGLLYRQATGRGLYIELAQRESMVCFNGEHILDYAMNGRLWPPMGNRHPWMAPHNVYPCRGDDRWVAIAVESDAQFQALCRALGRPELARDPRFADGLSRKRNEALLDPVIEEWTRQRDPYEAMDALQAEGVPAGAVLNIAQVVTDPHFRQLGVFQWVDYPDGRAYPIPQLPWQLDFSPPLEQEPVHPYGGDAGPVLGNLLGLAPEEVGRLKEEGAVLC